jgi:hypothetical protein
MRIIRQHLEIRNPIMARPCSKDISRTKRGKDGITTRRPSGDGYSLLIDLSGRDEVLHAGDSVFDVDDAPLPGETVAVFPTVAS